MRRSWETWWVVVPGVVVLAVVGCSDEPAENGGDRQSQGSDDAGQADDTADDSDDTNSTSQRSEAKMGVTKAAYGKTSDGTEVDLYTLTNDNGLTVKITTYGARIVAVETPDRDGKFANITLFRDSQAEYEKDDPYFGCVAGRYANRIAAGKFTLDGNEYTLATNNEANHLHGGDKGFDKYVWDAVPIDEEGLLGVALSLVSPDGDEGYPGKLSVSVTYSLNNDDELTIAYNAETDQPRC